MTKPIVFTGSNLDRAGHHRTNPEWLQERLQDPNSRFLPMHSLKALIDLKGQASIDWRSAEEIREFLSDDVPFIFLGLADSIAHFAIDVSIIDNPKRLPNTDWGKFIDVRSVAAQVSPGDAASLAQARSMIDWHNRHGFCAVCGTKTRAQELGYSRICGDESCGATHFPRTDPVAIMMVTKGDKCLLGQGLNFPSDFFSCLAGFIEPGETIEQGVRREVQEESGIIVEAVRYHASQPWPYPSSLMIGCFAEAVSEEITVDKTELGDARWFTRDDVRQMLANSGSPAGLRLSPPFALAHQLSKAWVE